MKIFSYLSKNGGPRLIAICGGYAFYSTTSLSVSGKTFVPFDGMKFSQLRGPKSEPGDFSQIFPQINDYIADKKDEEYLNLNAILRLISNFDTLAISMLIGGGYWETASGLSLKNHLSTHFPDYLKGLQEFIADDLKQIQLCLSDDSNHLIPQVDREMVNHHLAAESTHLRLIPLSGTQYSPWHVHYEDSLFVQAQPTYTKESFLQAHQEIVKLNQLRTLCEAYLYHLSPYGYREGLNPKLKEKFKAMQAILDQLGVPEDNPQGIKVPENCKERLANAKKTFIEKQSTLGANRDSMLILILKAIGHLFTLGLVSKCSKNTFAFWKSHGQVLVEIIKEQQFFPASNSN